MHSSQAIPAAATTAVACTVDEELVESLGLQNLVVETLCNCSGLLSFCWSHLLVLDQETWLEHFRLGSSRR